MSNIQISYVEKDVEDLLEEDCEHYLGVKFLKRQFRTPVGIIDVIARSTNTPRNLYFVIEIKKGAIDSSAYVQAVRYANWLNSEYSKEGNRLFIPMLIGSTLHEEISTICEYFDEEEICWYESHRKVFYRVFNFDPKNGVSFLWYNNLAKKHQERLENKFNHIQHLWDRIDTLEANNYYLQKQISEFNSPPETQESPAIRLVKDSGDAA